MISITPDHPVRGLQRSTEDVLGGKAQLGADAVAPAGVAGNIGAEVGFSGPADPSGDAFVEGQALADKPVGTGSGTGAENKLILFVEQNGAGRRAGESEDDLEVIGEQRVHLVRADGLTAEKLLLGLLEQHQFLEGSHLSAQGCRTGCPGRCLPGPGTGAPAASLSREAWFSGAAARHALQGPPV